MKKVIIYASIALIMILSILLIKTCRTSDVSSYFNLDDEGWRVMGDAQGESAVPDHHDTDGHPGGYLSANDNIAGGVWYWSAPEKFLGNKSSVSGKKLSYSLRQSSTDNQFDDNDIILVGSNLKIVYNTAKNPGTSWTDYSIPISEKAGWMYNDMHGDPVSRNDLKEILRDLTALYIRGEYVTGEDTGGLDNVVLHASKTPSQKP